jgi:fructuronate reductase
MVHLGIGNFTRAHQAWYTEHAPDAAEWGIAAFTGRRPDTADALAPQDGLYTLITRHQSGDTFEVISSLSKVHASTENDAFLGYLADPNLAVVTSTVTEAGYMRAADGHLDVANPRVAADVEALKADPRAVCATTPLKLVSGFLARRAAGVTGGITVLPCDNLPENGTAFSTVVLDGARAVDPSLAEWMAANVSWATCMVDRITPATTDEERAAVEAAQGYEDVSPVPTEPFAEWVVSGNFVAGRPRWEEAGVTIVDDVTPFEERKLWMLNGSHSLMAYAASIRGFETVADAINDPEVRGWVTEWWDVAARNLSVDSDDYRAALLDRFENPRIRHLLAQIAADGSQKIPVRIVPALRAEVAAGNLPDGPLRAVAAWIQHLRGNGAPVKDAQAATVLALVGEDLPSTVDNVLGWLDADLAANPAVVARINELATELVP